MRRGIPLALLLGLVACDDEPEITADAVPVRILTWNIGNPNDADPDYPLRLKHQVYEDFVGQQIRAFDADIVFLQEVLPPTHCATFTETDPGLTCYDAANRPSQAERVLGPDYTIVCDQRLHVECVGVKRSFGSITGVADGAFVLDGADTPPLPLESCEWAAGTCTDDLCDYESTVSAVTVETRWGSLQVVHLHPNAAGTGAAGFYTGALCRAHQLEQVFEGVDASTIAPLVDADRPTLLAGDFNMDPLRMIEDEEQTLWDAWVGDGNRFADLSPVDDDGITYGTRRGAMGMAIDHVLADRATGECTVYGWDDFGSDPGTDPLDQEFDWSQVPNEQYYPSRIDHFAISCDLTLDLH